MGRGALNPPILLDTCALLFIARSELREPAQKALDEADARDEGIFVSPITAWEIGLLVWKGRLRLALEPDRWFREALEDKVRLALLSPEVLVASSFLPGPPLRDPADRIIAATARAGGYRLMTRDRLLLGFADAGHALSIPC